MLEKTEFYMIGYKLKNANNSKYWVKTKPEWWKRDQNGKNETRMVKTKPERHQQTMYLLPCSSLNVVDGATVGVVVKIFEIDETDDVVADDESSEVIDKVVDTGDSKDVVVAGTVGAK